MFPSVFNVPLGAVYQQGHFYHGTIVSSTVDTLLGFLGTDQVN